MAMATSFPAYVASFVTPYRRALGATWRRGPFAHLQPLPAADTFPFQEHDPTAWSAFSDYDAGGASTAAVSLSPLSSSPSDWPPPPPVPSDTRSSSTSQPHVVRLSGTYSQSIRDSQTLNAIRRSGYAGMTYDFLQNDGEMGKMAGYDAIQLCVRTDGRPYVVSIRTDDWVAPVGAAKLLDAHQAFLFSPPNRWHVGVVPLDRFRRTHRGRLIEESTETMNEDRILSLSIGVGGAAPDVDALSSAEEAYESAVAPEAIAKQQDTPYSFELAWIRKVRLAEIR